MSAHQTRTDRPRGLARVVTLAGLVLLALAVGKELSKPPGSRTWHGTVVGVVPYDLRPPTLERFRQRHWAPEDERLFVPRTFGLGWAVNLARAVALVRRVTNRNMASSAKFR